MSTLRQSKSEATRERILETATRLFLDQGYSNTNLDQVATDAGVTKPTVYSHFHSKKGLFDAVVQRNASHRLAEIKSLLEPSDDIRTDLVRLGDLLISRILSKETCRWDRLAAAESIRHPEVGEAFFAAGPQQVVEGLASYLRFQKREGRIDFPHAQRAAECLIGMFLGLDLLRVQIGQAPPPISRLRRKCRESVDLFLAAYERPN